MEEIEIKPRTRGPLEVGNKSGWYISLLGGSSFSLLMSLFLFFLQGNLPDPLKMTFMAICWGLPMALFFTILQRIGKAVESFPYRKKMIIGWSSFLIVIPAVISFELVLIVAFLNSEAFLSRFILLFYFFSYVLIPISGILFWIEPVKDFFKTRKAKRVSLGEVCPQCYATN